MKQAQKEILKKIEAASAFEEKAVPLYSNHIAQSLLQSGLEPAARAEAETILRRLADESRGHIALLKQVREIYLSNQE